MSISTPWTTVFPGAQDDLPVQQPTLLDDVVPGDNTGDRVLVSHMLTMRDKVQALALMVGDDSDLPGGSIRDRLATLEAGAGGGAPVGATYITLSTNGTLTNERVLAADVASFDLTDGGAGGNLTLTLKAGGVSSAQLRDSAALSVLGRGLNSVGVPGDIVAGTNGHYLRRAADTLSFGAIVDADLPANLVRNTITISTTGGIQGGGDLSANRSLSLTDVGPGATTTGGAGIASITTDAKGRITGIATASYLTTGALSIAQHQIAFATATNVLGGSVGLQWNNGLSTFVAHSLRISPQAQRVAGGASQLQILSDSSPVSARLVIGDATGWRLNLASVTAGLVTEDLFQFRDSGEFHLSRAGTQVIRKTGTGELQIVQEVNNGAIRFYTGSTPTEVLHLHANTDVPGRATFFQGTQNIVVSPDAGILSHTYAGEANTRYTISRDLYGSGKAGIAFGPGGSTSLATGGAGIGLASTGVLGVYATTGAALAEVARFDLIGSSPRVGIGTAGLDSWDNFEVVGGIMSSGGSRFLTGGIDGAGTQLDYTSNTGRWTAASYSTGLGFTYRAQITQGLSLDVQLGTSSLASAAKFDIASTRYRLNFPQGRSHITFGAGTNGAPSTFDNWKVILYDTGTPAGSYGVGLEGAYTWFHSGGSPGGFKWYTAGTEVGRVNTGAWLFANGSAGAPATGFGGFKYHEGTGKLMWSQNNSTFVNLDAFSNSSITITAGAGLTGGGDLTANRTISMPNVGPGAVTTGGTGIASITTDAQGRITAIATATYGGGAAITITAGHVAFATATNTLGGTNRFTWDNATTTLTLGDGTTNPRIVGLKSSFSSYNVDGLFHANVRPAISVDTPNSNSKVMLGYDDTGAGAFYQAAIGFDATGTASANTLTVLRTRGRVEANDVFSIGFNGTLSWGGGGGSPVDITLARSGGGSVVFRNAGASPVHVSAASGSLAHAFAAEANSRWSLARDAFGSGKAGILFGAGGGSTLDASGAGIGLTATANLGLFASNGSAQVEVARVYVSAGRHILNFTQSASLISFSAGAVGAPSSYDNYKVLLWDSGSASGSYGIGMEGSNVWYNSQSGHKWYASATNVASLNSGGGLALGSSVAPRYMLDVTGGASGQIHFGNGTADSGGYLISTNAQQAFLAAGTNFNAGWIAKSTVASLFLTEGSTGFAWYSNTGLTIGASYSPTQWMTLTPAGDLTVQGGSSTASRVAIAQATGSVTHTYVSESHPRWQLHRDGISSGQAGLTFGSGGASIATTGSGIGFGGTFSLGFYVSNGAALEQSARMEYTSARHRLGFFQPRSHISFGGSGSSAAVGAPSSYDNWKLLLWDSASPGGSYGFGVEGNHLWNHSASGFKWYMGGVNYVTIDSVGKTTLGSSVAPRYYLDVTGVNGSQIHFASNTSDAGGYLVSTGDSQAILAGGAAWSGALWVAKATQASAVLMQNGTIAFNAAGGLTPGAGMGGFSTIATLDIVSSRFRQVFGNANSHITFGTSTLAAPSSYDGYRIIAYDSGGAGSSYGLGMMSNNLWLNGGSLSVIGASGIKFHVGGNAAANVENFLDTVGTKSCQRIYFPQATSRLDFGAGSVFSPLTGYQGFKVLAYDSGASSTSYGLGMEFDALFIASGQDLKFYGGGQRHSLLSQNGSLRLMGPSGSGLNYGSASVGASIAMAPVSTQPTAATLSSGVLIVYNSFGQLAYRDSNNVYYSGWGV